MWLLEMFRVKTFGALSKFLSPPENSFTRNIVHSTRCGCTACPLAHDNTLILHNGAACRRVQTFKLVRRSSRLISSSAPAKTRFQRKKCPSTRLDTDDNGGRAAVIVARPLTRPPTS
uniref:Uncharacterized protein n=1 Tax=Schizaphis graminum TaxID=13262 RepID=A0A2S2N7T3_SCHGA